MALLERWSGGKPCLPKYLNLDVVTLDWYKYDIVDGIKPSIDGWFEEYPEGRFAVIENYPQGVLVVWKSVRCNITEDTKIDWQVTAFGRKFKLIRSGKLCLEVNYFTWRRFIYRPWKLLDEILMPDDDWGLLNDLPSFVHSVFTSGQSLHSMLIQWNQRNS